MRLGAGRMGVVAAGVIGAAAGGAAGQSLLQRPADEPPVVATPPVTPRPVVEPLEPGTVAPAPARPAPANPAPSLREYSLFAVVPPAPRVFQKQDIIQIIINETSIQKFEQKLDRKKEYDLSGSIDKLPDLVKLLELRLEPGDRSPLAEVGAGGESEFKGDGRVERKDQLSTRVSARIIEIKPNGLLLLEARKTVQSDDEITTVVVSGLCRPEDVTKSNTVQSTQLADLGIRVENEVEARNAARRGLIPRVLDTVFNF